MSGAQGKHGEQVAVGIVPGLNGGQFKGRLTMLFEMTVAASFAVPLGKPLQFVYAEHGT